MRSIRWGWHLAIHFRQWMRQQWMLSIGFIAVSQQYQMNLQVLSIKTSMTSNGMQPIPSGLQVKTNPFQATQTFGREQKVGTTIHMVNAQKIILKMIFRGQTLDIQTKGQIPNNLGQVKNQVMLELQAVLLSVSILHL